MTSPIARVAIDNGLPHLDRFFDYSVPPALDELARPGVRVKVGFGAGSSRGRLVDGFVIQRLTAGDQQETLRPLRRVVSPEPVLTTDTLKLCRAVADRYAGTLADVLRFAVPARHARAEEEPSPAPLPPPAPPAPGGWTRYTHGPSFLSALADGRSPRAVWAALPGPEWARQLADAVIAALSSGRGATVLLPHGRAVDAVDSALLQRIGPGHHVALTADLGPEERYRRWLAIRRGAVAAVVGTRAAMYAPVAHLGLVVIWDDGNSSHREPRSPYPHARDVLLLRAVEAGAGVLIGGFAVSVESALLLREGWAHAFAAEPGELRRTAPAVRAHSDSDLAAEGSADAARVPSTAWRTVKEALARGHVLVQVPRAGYAPGLICRYCRRRARCSFCAGPLAAHGAGGTVSCGWCARPESDWRCRDCGATGLRAQVVGAQRTAEELARSFPTVPVHVFSRGTERDSIPDAPSLVVSTPGAEPVVPDGYAAALLLDGGLLVGRPDLRADEEALRHWLGAAGLVRSRALGGSVLLLAEAGRPPVQGLVRWDPVGFALRELDDRAELGLPPARRMASVSGGPEAVADLLRRTVLPRGTDVLGPIEDSSDSGAPNRDQRVLLRVPPGQAAAVLARSLQKAQAAHARAGLDPVRVRFDPPEVG